MNELAAATAIQGQEKIGTGSFSRRSGVQEGHKDKLLAQFEPARRMVGDVFRPSSECHANEIFSRQDRECATCTQAQLCNWLCASREALAARPQARLLDLLQFAVDCAVTSSLDRDHDPHTCACEVCEWVRGSEALIEEVNRACPDHRGGKAAS